MNILISLRFPIVVFGLLWLNINSGYWNLLELDTPIQMLHAFRGVMPYILMPLGFMLHRMRPRLGGRLNPVSYLEVYGWIALFASLLSRHFVAASYFGLAFLANIYIPQFFLYKWRDMRSERVLLYLTWGVIAMFTMGIIFVVRDNLFVGYSVTGLYRDGVSGMAMSRSSGIARFFGAVSLLALCRLWGGKGHWRWLWALPMSFSAMIVWSMQSRGAMIGFAVGVVMLLLIARASKMIYALICSVLLIVYVGGHEASILKKVDRQVRRGQDTEELESMSGRTGSYKKAFEVIAKNPLIGQGNWADRIVMKEHAHNSCIQALLNGGILGFVPYLLSWIVGWRLFGKLLKKREQMDPVDRQLFLEASIIMMYFAVRSIPETTTASFSIASMIMIPVYLYMVVLYERMKEKDEEMEG